MIYQIQKNDEKNEFIVNNAIVVKIVSKSNETIKTEVEYEKEILTSNEAKALNEEFLTYLNSLNHI